MSDSNSAWNDLVKEFPKQKTKKQKKGKDIDTLWEDLEECVAKSNKTKTDTNKTKKLTHYDLNGNSEKRKIRKISKKKKFVVDIVTNDIGEQCFQSYS